MTPLDDAAILARLTAGLDHDIGPDSRVLVLVPDRTRTAPMARLAPLAARWLRDRGARCDFMIALGTHRPLDDGQIVAHLGIDDSEHWDGVNCFNHVWDEPAALVTLGHLEADEVAELCDGLLSERVALTVNRQVADYDTVLVLGPVFPHELVGFSGGSKYIFPGISGPEMIDFTHWLGALRTSAGTIGFKDTPIRRVLNAAVDRLPFPVLGACFVVHDDEIVAFESGSLHAAWGRAADVAARSHLTPQPRMYSRLIACCPAMYPDLWTGGKCMYKCEMIVRNGGELIIYAPHVTAFSEVHGRTVERVGYHVADYYTAHWERYAKESRAVMAYCSLVKGSGTYRDGREHPRIKVTFATGIPREACERVGIDWCDPADVDLAACRLDPDTFVVERAGETLYLPLGDPRLQ